MILQTFRHCVGWENWGTENIIIIFIFIGRNNEPNKMYYNFGLKMMMI